MQTDQQTIPLYAFTLCTGYKGHVMKYQKLFLYTHHSTSGIIIKGHYLSVLEITLLFMGLSNKVPAACVSVHEKGGSEGSMT